MLQQRDETLEMSANYGKNLLESNSALEEKLSKQSTEAAIEIEELQQENHELRMRIEQSGRSMAAGARLITRVLSRSNSYMYKLIFTLYRTIDVNDRAGFRAGESELERHSGCCTVL